MKLPQGGSVAIVLEFLSRLLKTEPSEGRMLRRESDFLSIRVYSESMLGDHVHLFSPQMTVAKAGDRHRRDGIQSHKGRYCRDATLFLCLADGRFQGRLTILAAASNALPVTIVRTPEQRELEFITTAAIREDEYLKWCSRHVRPSTPTDQSHRPPRV